MNRRLFGFILVVLSLILYNFMNRITPTQSIWSAVYDQEVLSAPCRAGRNAALLGGRKEIALFNKNGQLVARQNIPREPKFPLIEVGPAVVLTDRQSGVRAYSVDALQLLWERALVTSPRLAPSVLPNDRLLVATTREALFALEGATGNPAWEANFQGEVVRVSVGSSVACIFGYTDVLKPVWKLRAIDVDSGVPLWTFPESVIEQTPLVYKDMFVFVNSAGRPIAVDQITGDVRFRVDGEGYRVFQAEGDYLLLLAQGGTRIDCYSITGKNSWSTTLPAQMVNSTIIGGRVMLADRQGLRCANAANGDLYWQLELGTVLLAYPYRNGLCVVYKQYFVDRQSLFAYFDSQAGKPEWTCVDSTMFHRPIAFGSIDFVVSRAGNIFGMQNSNAEKAGAASGFPIGLQASGSVQFWDGKPVSPERPGASATPDQSSGTRSPTTPGQPSGSWE